MSESDRLWLEYDRLSRLIEKAEAEAGYLRNLLASVESQIVMLQNHWESEDEPVTVAAGSRSTHGC
jgi:hypothetical protein